MSLLISDNLNFKCLRCAGGTNSYCGQVLKRSKFDQCIISIVAQVKIKTGYGVKTVSVFVSRMSARNINF